MFLNVSDTHFMFVDRLYQCFNNFDQNSSVPTAGVLRQLASRGATRGGGLEARVREERGVGDLRGSRLGAGQRTANC